MKKKPLSLRLNRIKIVNLHTLHNIYGASDGTETDPNNPEASCGDCSSDYCTLTGDKTNTNNTVPTVLQSKTCDPRDVGN